MRVVLTLVGLVLLVGGLLGLALEAYLYFGGHYHDAAAVSVRAMKANTETQPDPERDRARVEERVREKLTQGIIVAGLPAAIGAGILLLARRKRPDAAR